VDAQMARVTDPEWLPEILNARARIAASLGEREAAVRFLSDAYRAGLGRRDLGHIWREFGPLHGYPPFETLTAPVD
jgi:hypothetical protein